MVVSLAQQEKRQAAVAKASLRAAIQMARGGAFSP